MCAALRNIAALILLTCSAVFSQENTCTRNQFRCHDGECIDKNAICNGRTDCFDESDEISAVCLGTRCPNESFQCGYGACIHETLKCDGVEDCRDESDEDFELCEAYVQHPTARPPAAGCPLTRLVGIDRIIETLPTQEEQSWRVELNNRKNVKPNSHVKFHCSYGYTASWRGHETNCTGSSRWNPMQPVCISCGQNYRVRPLIFHASLAQRDEHPWHAALFIRTKDEGKESIDYICGGSIINEKAIITAAHCLYDGATQKIPVQKEELRIAVGKFYGEWNIKEDTEQKFMVRRVLINRKYASADGSYSNDIAILIVEGTMTFTKAVRPVCVDVEDAYPIKSLEKGTVVGWGYTETGAHSVDLRVATLNFYDWSYCWKQAGQNFKRYVTSDKFCAGLFNGTYLSSGDSGGGLISSYGPERIQYLHGVVSTAEDSNFNITLFTDIGAHRRWIKEVLNSIDDM